MAKNLFPLPLSFFERYMLADDRPEYPMAFVIAVELSGDLQRVPFQQALAASIERHPLLTSVVRRCLIGGHCWMHKPELPQHCDWQETGAELEAPNPQQIDLYREPGLRVWVRKQAQRSCITFQFHHAATDGLGAMQFIGDLLALYGIQTVAPGQDVPALEPLDLNALKHRGIIGTGASLFKLPFIGAFEFFKLLKMIPVPAALPRKESLRDATPLPFPAFVTRTFSRSVHQQLKERASQKLVTPNDLLAWAMFRTIRDWNRLQGTGSDKQHLRLAIPVSLRTPLHDQMPAANCVSYQFLNERAGNVEDEQQTLQSIHHRTQPQSSRAVAESIILGTQVGFLFPPLVTAVLKFNPCLATVTLANVGDVRRQFRGYFPLKQGKVVAGNIQLESLLGAAPVRRNSRVSVSLGVYAGTLYVNMHCDPQCFTRAQAESLADMYAARIRSLVDATADGATATPATPQRTAA